MSIMYYGVKLKFIKTMEGYAYLTVLSFLDSSRNIKYVTIWLSYIFRFDVRISEHSLQMILARKINLKRISKRRFTFLT